MLWTHPGFFAGDLGARRIVQLLQGLVMLSVIFIVVGFSALPLVRRGGRGCGTRGGTLGRRGNGVGRGRHGYRRVI